VPKQNASMREGDSTKQENKRFFFEKKKQKTFANVGFGDAGATTRRSRIFLLLFF
jgi:hypothetical protein